jgi:hypothetical protein
MKQILFFFLLLPSILFAQNTKRDSIWLTLKPFVGSWAGEGGGEPGNGKYERSYQFVLGKRFIEIRNKSTYPPTTQNPKGEVHEDIGYLSYDNSRKTFILRQFHTEGFVNQFKLDSISADKKTLVFISEAIENIPKGWRAKETYRILSDDEIEETFELAEPDKEFAVYTKVKLVRQK